MGRIANYLREVLDVPEDGDSSFSSSSKPSKKKKRKGPIVNVPPNFQVPEPKPLQVTGDYSSVTKGSIAFITRLATGTFVLGWKIDTLFAPEEEGKYALKLGPLRVRDVSTVLDQAPRPSQPLILYEYTASPFCARVRETINILDLTVECRPCPGARQSTFSDELFEKTGRRTVPYLIDPNTGMEMFESDDQIQYLLDTYGPSKDVYDAKALWPVTFQPFSIFTSVIGAVARGFPGAKRQENARPDNEKMEPLELWGNEASPFVKPVQEKLVSLALPYKIVSCSRGSVNRDLMVQKTGRFQVPFLVDPNTGLELFESIQICEYLEACYTVKE